ncbi:MAG: hypothetical protein AAGP08_01535 [Pseudomonadota bacterium]
MVRRFGLVGALSVLLSVTAVGAAVAHIDDEGLPINTDDIFIPRNVALLHMIRFTRADHRLLQDRIAQGDEHHIGTMTLDLTRLTVAAGALSPRPTARLVWNMAQLNANDERAALLDETEANLMAGLAEYQADPEADPLDIEIIQALLDLIAHWKTNPMDGAGS